MTGRFWFHRDVTPLLEPLSHVRPHPRNANMGDVDAIIESIQTNGFTAPVLAQRSTGFIVAGNHRYAALHELGADQIPVIWLDLDDEQALRYMLADNRSTRLGKDDLGLLHDALTDLAQTTTGLTGSLFDEEYMNLLEESLNDPFTEDDNEDYAKQRTRQMFECPRCGWKAGE